LKKRIIQSRNELRSEYDASSLKGGVRGKYVRRYSEGTNLVLLAPDVAQAFPSDEAVNEALRSLIKVNRDETPQRSSPKRN
jgi:hypothetical protein